MISIGSIAKVFSGTPRRTAGIDGCTDLGVDWNEQDQSRYHPCARGFWLVLACRIALLFHVYNLA